MSTLEELHNFIASYEDDNQAELARCTCDLMSTDFDIMTNKETVFCFAVFQIEEEVFLNIFRSRLESHDIAKFNEEFKVFKSE